MVVSVRVSIMGWVGCSVNNDYMYVNRGLLIDNRGRLNQRYGKERNQ